LTSFTRYAFHASTTLAREAFARLPDDTQTHARAAATEGVAALRSLADGASDATERVIDRITALISKR